MTFATYVLHPSCRRCDVKRSNILCPIDFSADSEATLSLASTLAEIWNAQLHLVHVHEIPFATADGGLVFRGSLEECTTAEAKQLARVRPTKDGLCQHYLTVGEPADELLCYADAHKIDLIVLGTHGRTGIRRLLMGSVAEAVVRGASCPVLTLKIPRHAQRGSSLEGLDAPQQLAPVVLERLKNVLCPIDFSERSKAALDIATQIARVHDAKLFIVHVEENPAMVQPSLLGLPPAGWELNHRLSEYEPSETGVRFERDLLVGNVPEQVVDYAERRAIDLIVIGSHGHTGMLRKLVGSVAEDLVSKSTIPVLTLKLGAVSPAVERTPS